MFRRILVPLDGSRFAEQALPRALSVAADAGATLELAMVALPAGAGRSSAGVAFEESREKSMDRARRYLEQVEEGARDAGFAGEVVRSVLPAGNVVASLVRQVREAAADLVVMTTHGLGPLQRAWLGSTADGFIRSAACPVLLLRPREEDEEGGIDVAVGRRPFSRVLVPLDGSRAAERLLPLVEALPGAADSLMLLRVVSPVHFSGYPPYLPHVAEEDHEHREAVRAAGVYLEEVAEGIGANGRSVDVKVESSPRPASAILEVAKEEGVDLIAMSTAGRGGVARFFLGSVADKVVRSSPVPVLLFREPDAD